MRVLKSAFSAYTQVVPRMPDELKNAVDGASTPEALYETIAFNINMPVENRQDILEAPSLSDKLSVLLAILSKETQILAIEKDIHMKVGEAIDRGQREYYLREEMRIIREELGEEEDPADESYQYLEKIAKLGLSEESVEKLVGEAKRLEKMPFGSQGQSSARQGSLRNEKGQGQNT